MINIIFGYVYTNLQFVLVISKINTSSSFEIAIKRLKFIYRIIPRSIYISDEPILIFIFVSLTDDMNAF